MAGNSVRLKMVNTPERDSGPLEITHQRLSYAVALVDRRRIFLETGFWACPPRQARGPGFREMLDQTI